MRCGREARASDAVRRASHPRYTSACQGGLQFRRREWGSASPDFQEARCVPSLCGAPSGVDSGTINANGSCDQMSDLPEAGRAGCGIDRKSVV